MNAEERRQTEDQLRLLEGILIGMDRREEVFRVVDDAKDPEEAAHRLAAELEIDESASRGILHMQVVRWTGGYRTALAAEVERLRASLLPPGNRGQ